MGIGIRDLKVTCLSDFPTFHLRCTSERQGVIFMPKLDLSGKRFGNLIVISRGEKTKHGVYRWNCKCDCGKFTSVPTNDLQSGHTRSCGCLRKSDSSITQGCKTRHLRYGFNNDGRSKHPLYGTWNQMISRCENPNALNYKRYGAKGISVCKEWHDFWKFVEWSDSIGGRSKGFTLDRIDCNGDYEPSNCRWANNHVQAMNKSSSILLTHNGKTETLATWAKIIGISDQAMYNRYNRGWSEEDMFLPNQTGNNGFKGRH